MNRKQHEKWLRKHGVSREQIKAAKKKLGSPNTLAPVSTPSAYISLSNSVPSNGTIDPLDRIMKEKISQQYATMPAYNKGPVMVVSRKEIQYAGKK